ncbi:MAG: hypothetical protein KIT84_40100 [Labilithrix sp.]|nr:hypothetical protein [Labilithrix sp.]MCW5817269.1 hypothetical protein [Labilithrix sp.]
MNAPKRIEPSLSVRRASGTRPVSVVHRHAGVVRTLLEEVDRTAPSDLPDAVDVQLAEELGRLGCRCVELAAALAKLAEEQRRARDEAPLAPARCA